MDEGRNEVHITGGPLGHCLSSDCWCEPNRIYWYTNQHGLRMLVVEHNDETNVNHKYVLAAREESYFLEGDGHPDAPWVTRVLNDPNMTVPRKPKEMNP